ncbi:MAG: CDP-alcohol phosphatidyltransferase family protein [Candidatus Saccharibacteria bacterium]
MNILDALRKMTRKFMHGVAVVLDKISGGRISPSNITIIGLLAHLPIAYFIAVSNNLYAAGLLVVFGLFDTLDGELARLQKRASPAGMLLDASTDRMKEVMLYTGVAYAITLTDKPTMAVWAVIACGASLTVSYVKAKGETAIAKSQLTTTEINLLFADGLMRFEVRMGVLLIGLLSGQVVLAVVIIAIFSSITAVSRLIKISQKI